MTGRANQSLEEYGTGEGKYGLPLTGLGHGQWPENERKSRKCEIGKGEELTKILPKPSGQGAAGSIDEKKRPKENGTRTNP